MVADLFVCAPLIEAYLHSRMRSRTTYFLKVLNRAKPEKPEDQVHQKTARCVVLAPFLFLRERV